MNYDCSIVSFPWEILLFWLPVSPGSSAALLDQVKPTVATQEKQVSKLGWRQLDNILPWGQLDTNLRLYPTPRPIPPTPTPTPTLLSLVEWGF